LQNGQQNFRICKTANDICGFAKRIIKFANLQKSQQNLRICKTALNICGFAQRTTKISQQNLWICKNGQYKIRRFAKRPTKLADFRFVTKESFVGAQLYSSDKAYRCTLHMGMLHDAWVKN
jgi:hypothetical protein